MSSIAEAFVRIRPDSTGFKSETERSVRAGLVGVGSIIAGAFAVKGAFDFGKGLVTHAEDVQKQVEAIRSEFGAASEEILRFGEHGAATLGVSAHEAETTAARFGILFKQLGIGRDQAATMTVGFEQLAGSISQIRNIDPATVFASLPLAIAGNLRSLKQLGIATDATQLQIAAFKLGLTDTITQALTPAQRAQAIYAVATAHLGEIQQQALSHSSDLANQQRRLTAEWDNAKDALGRGLIPEVSNFATFLADKLPGAITKIRQDFRDLTSTLGSITGPVGGIKRAVEGLLAAFAIGKIAAFADAIRTDLIANGFTQLRIATEAEKAAYIEAFGVMEIATVGLAATIRGALISTGIGALVVAAGFAAELIINHFSTVERFFGDAFGYIKRGWAATMEALRQASNAVAYGVLQYFTLAIRGILEVASHLPFIGHYARSALTAIQGELDRFKPDFGKVSDAFSAGGQKSGDSFAAAFHRQFVQQVATFGGTLPALSALLGKHVNDAVSAAAAGQQPAAIVDKGAAAKTARDQVGQLTDAMTQAASASAQKIGQTRTQIADLGHQLADAIKQEAQDVKDAVAQAKQNLATIGTGLAQTVDQFVDAGPLGQAIKRLQDQLTLRQTSAQRAQLEQSVTSARKTLQDVLDAVGPATSQTPSERSALNAFVAPQRQALDQAKAALADFGTQQRIGQLQSQADRLKQSTDRGIADLTDEFNKGAINVHTFSLRIADLLSRDGITYKRAGKLLGTSFADGWKSEVGALLDQAQAIAVSPRSAGGATTSTIVRPLDTLAKDQASAAKIQHQIGTKQVQLSERIAKAAETTAATLEKIRSVQLGPTAVNVPPPGRKTVPASTRRR